MKAFFVHLRVRLALLALLAVTPVHAETLIKDPLALKVQVNVPASWNILLDDRIAEDFVDGVGQVLRRRGFSRPVEALSLVEAPEKTPYLLTLNLVEWRMNRTGSIDCTLHAQLQTPRGTRNLGVYHASSFHSPGTGRWSLARDFDEAASEVLNQLGGDIAKSELLPALPDKAT
jgi:hypothetical protein